jgi:cobalt-zinc-cadmium efflux system membrane fusion protein
LCFALGLGGCTRLSPVPETPPNAPASAAEVDFLVMPPDTQRSVGVETAAVRTQTVPETLRVPARLTNDENRTWRVGAIAEGRIVRVLVAPGDAVRGDQILALMHSHEVHESRALYKKAKADLARARGAAEYAQVQRDRAQRLLDLKAGSLAQLEQRQTELRNAETEVNNALTELERTRTHLEEVLGIPAEQSSAPGTGREEDDDLIPIRAPAAGIVLARNVTPGTVVSPANDLFLISDLSSLWAIAEVGEEHLSRLRVGIPVRVFVTAYGEEPFQGRIGKLGELLNPDTRTIQVRVELPNRHGRLKPEMYATAEIQLGSGGAAVVVPSEAIQDVRGQTVVFVATSPDRFEVRPVRVGRTIDNSVEIAAGLRDGETIAVKSTFLLKSEFLKASLQAE